jgi:hypothetical protein
LRLTFASTIHPEHVLEIDLKARVAQLVEHDLAKVGVASSNLVSRSTKPLQKGFVISGHFYWDDLSLYIDVEHAGMVE